MKNPNPVCTGGVCSQYTSEPRGILYNNNCLMNETISDNYQKLIEFFDTKHGIGQLLIIIRNFLIAINMPNEIGYKDYCFPS